MSSKILVFLISLAIICLALPDKKFMADGCDRPAMFRNMDELQKFVKCLKGSTTQRYGKRSQPSPSLILRHLVPSHYADYGSQSNQDLQEFYDMLKYDDN